MQEKAPLQQLYQSASACCAALRKKLGRPLTLSEKIFATHATDLKRQEFTRWASYLSLMPDRVAMQDATAQMAILQFMLAERTTVAVPTTVHCDHLIQARVGAAEDTQRALEQNREVYDFLRSAAQKYGMGFWEPGAGIIHQVVLEQYAFPGGLLIGTDSHTPNAGGLGMLAIGVGGADAADVMAGLPWEIKCPKLIAVYLTGSLNGWTAPKDVILKVCELLTTQGGTDKILEYIGPGTQSISATGKGTITNMGAELGATTSIFPFDERMTTYLRATRRAAIADLTEPYRDWLVPDPEVLADPKRFYDEVIEINLSTLEPYVVGPHSPDVARPVSQLKRDVEQNKYPAQLRAALLGSCTNSSYEDIGRAAAVARQAQQAGLKTHCYFLITPGSDQIHNTIRRDGQLALLEAIGGTVLANACGPCIGQWKRDDIKPGERNSIITSFNRNFPRRNDGNAETLAFIGSPEIITAFALAGDLRFNPLTDPLMTPDGRRITLEPPVAPELPSLGFAIGEAGYLPPLPDTERQRLHVRVPPNSERLQQLQPFPAWGGQNLERMPILLKAKGKCTTDHISPAGPWLKYRGHLDKISDNLFAGAVNAFTSEAGTGVDQLDGTTQALPKLARRYYNEGIAWVVVGDENYGEGSSREHAAMSPRYLGCKAVIAKSFARIHETNLKKQGIVPLTFTEPSLYDHVQTSDRVSLLDLPALAPERPVRMILHHADGADETMPLQHSMTSEQIAWFKAGSALNLLRMQGR